MFMKNKKKKKKMKKTEEEEEEDLVSFFFFFFFFFRKVSGNYESGRTQKFKSTSCSVYVFPSPAKLTLTKFINPYSFHGLSQLRIAWPWP